MFELTVVSNFSSAHRLKGYNGKCEKLHGHNWKVSVGVESDELNSIGISMDFREIREELNKVLDKLDHKNLNELTFFRKVNPSSENIASLIHSKLSSNLDERRVKVKRVSVWETDTACATYLV